MAGEGGLLLRHRLHTLFVLADALLRAAADCHMARARREVLSKEVTHSGRKRRWTPRPAGWVAVWFDNQFSPREETAL